MARKYKVLLCILLWLFSVLFRCTYMQLLIISLSLTCNHYQKSSTLLSCFIHMERPAKVHIQFTRLTTYTANINIESMMKY